jgi:hypothetical protein
VKHAISVNAESPSGKLVYSGARLQSDEAQFDVIFPGTYTFCFINLQSTPANTSILTQNPFIFFDLRLIDGGESWKEQKEEEQQRLAKEAEENDIRNAMMNETLNRIYEYGEKVGRITEDKK